MHILNITQFLFFTNYVLISIDLSLRYPIHAYIILNSRILSIRKVYPKNLKPEFLTYKKIQMVFVIVLVICLTSNTHLRPTYNVFLS